MTALAIERDTRQLANSALGYDLLELPVKAGEKILQGAIVLEDSSGRAVKGKTATSLTIKGRCEATADNTSGADGDVKVIARRGVFKWLNSVVSGTTIGASNAALSLVPNKAGVTFRIVDPGTTTASESVSVTGSAISVTGRYSGSLTSTGAQILAAVLASAAAMALLTSAALASGSDGTGTVIAVSATPLVYDAIYLVDSTAYVVDDQTLAATDGGSARSGSCTVQRIDADGVYVRCGV